MQASKFKITLIKVYKRATKLIKVGSTCLRFLSLDPFSDKYYYTLVLV